VTGATGFVGKHLVKRLLKEGHNVRCVVRKKSDTYPLRELGVELHYGDITDAASLKGCSRHTEVVFHLAGVASVSRCIQDPKRALLTNTLGTLHMLEEIRNNSAAEGYLFVYVSSDRVYGNQLLDVVSELNLPLPIEPYGSTKLAGELLCQAYTCTDDMQNVIFRIANTYGPQQSTDMFISGIIQKIVAEETKFLPVGNIAEYRNFVYIEDAIDAFLLALSNKSKARNQTFNISQCNAKIEDVIAMLIDSGFGYLGRKLKTVQDPTLMRPKSMEARRFELDCTKARDILGWQPRYLLGEGLKQTLEFYVGKKKK
jgi:UDP-glucose 4-epimerase